MTEINIYNADCLPALREIKDNEFDLAIVDPPYNLKRFRNGIGDGDRHKSKTHSIEWNNNAPTKEYFKQLFRVSVNQVVWGANNFILPPSEYFCIWNKKQTVENFASAEYAWVSMGLKKPAKVFEYSIHKHNQTQKIHICQKPIALYKWLLTNYAKEGNKILDTHFGSGSIAIACWEMGFDLTAYELDKDYFEAAKNRITNHVAQQRLFLESGKINWISVIEGKE